jgi:hypothetical protein
VRIIIVVEVDGVIIVLVAVPLVVDIVLVVLARSIITVSVVQLMVVPIEVNQLVVCVIGVMLVVLALVVLIGNGVAHQMLHVVTLFRVRLIRKRVVLLGVSVLLMVGTVPILMEE